MIKFALIAVGFFVVVLCIIIVSILTSKSRKLNRNAEIIRELLPGLNCGKCGRPHCAKFALDITKGKTTVNECPFVIGSQNYFKIRQLVKRERKVHFDNVAVIRCKGGNDCQTKFEYKGDKSCACNNLLHSGDKACPFACLGCGDCKKACVYGAISISDKGCAEVDPYKCIGCGECVNFCPNNLITLVPSDKYVEVICRNSSNDTVVTRNCKVSCTHCEACVVACPYGAIQMVGGLPHIDKVKCRRCGKCVAACPNHVISRI